MIIAISDWKRVKLQLKDQIRNLEQDIQFVKILSKKTVFETKFVMKSRWTIGNKVKHVFIKNKPRLKCGC